MKVVNKHVEDGYVVLGVLLVMSLSFVITSGMLTSASVSMKTRAIVNQHTDYYYEVEDTLGKVVTWLQDNSKNLVGAFSSANFNTNFTIGAPSNGTNEGTHFQVPTMVKLAGTNESAMLSNNEFFGTTAFPPTEHIDTSVSFDAAAEYASADLGSANSRVVLVWARETDGNYEPIFRIDVVTGNNPDRGVHSFSYLYSTLVTAGGTGSGFFGESYLTTKGGNNKCFSYQFSYNAGSGHWNKGAPRSNCTVGTDGPLTLKSQINGDAGTNTAGGITLQNPTGEISGTACDGIGCVTDTLPAVTDWATYCPTHEGNLNINSDTTLSADSSTHCWQNVTINSNDSLTLDTTDHPYYFKYIDFKNNAELKFAPGGPTETVTVYVEQLNSNNRVNGGQLVNTDNAPHQLDLYYIGTTDLKLNGNADMYANFISPNAGIELQGNFDFYGGIKAEWLWLNGNGRFNQDESLSAGAPVLSDINFSVRKASQRYR